MGWARTGLVPDRRLGYGLDRLKESKNPRVRWRSGYTLAVLERILSEAGRGTLHPVDTSTLLETGTFRADTSVEVLFDQPGHVRLPHANDEIIDRGLGAHDHLRTRRPQQRQPVQRLCPGRSTGILLGSGRSHLVTRLRPRRASPEPGDLSWSIDQLC